MFLFVGTRGRALVSRSDLATFSSFSIPELDNTISAIVTDTQVVPRPAVQIQGTLGGRNYINVFGEDPMQIQIGGIVVGTQCNQINRVSSALGTTVDFFQKNGVVNRALPLRFTITGNPSREAFLVGITITQQSAFADMVRFQMMLLADSLQDTPAITDPDDPSTDADEPDGSDLFPTNRSGLINVNAQSITSRVLSVPASLLLPSGGVNSPVVANVPVAGYLTDEDGVSNLAQ